MSTVPRLALPATVVFTLSLLHSPAAAQAPTAAGEFVSGQAAATWEKWKTAMQALLARDKQVIEFAFGELLADNPSPLRLALFAERTITQRDIGGAVLLLEQDLQAGALGEKGKHVVALLETGREQMNEADDGWWFASIGRSDIANANFSALLKGDVDPVALLEFADSKPGRRELLVQVSDNPVVGEAARGILRLLQAGEERVKADPFRIKQHVDELGGPPRAFDYALARLKESGEYAIPFLVQALRDPQKKDLNRAVIRTLPLVDRPGLNPLVMALRMRDDAVRRYVIAALGQIGYFTPVPYLLALRDDEQTPAEIRAAAEAALRDLSSHGVPLEPGLTAAEAFYRLAKAYYNNQRDVAADPRLDTANVWYWKDDLLVNVPVPAAIFNEVMAMRCCEEALLRNADLKPALALWLAANFRREAQLPEGASDPTRPENYPSALYFAETAGPEYCLMALAWAVDDGDPAVALGAIEGLRRTAGPASIMGTELGRQPLAEALSFTDRLVRVRAALALANALPSQPFHNSQNLMPVLSEALLLHSGSKSALLVEPDAATANTLGAALRDAGYEVLSDANLFAGLQKVRTQTPGVDVILIASDIRGPALAEGLKQLRAEFRFANTPVIVIAKPADRSAVRDVIAGDHRSGHVPPDVASQGLATAIAAVSRAVGAKEITPEVGGSLALEAATVLRLLAVTNNPLFRPEQAEPALIAAMDSRDAALRKTVAQVLAHVGTTPAQEAIARVALNETEPLELRGVMFAAVAEAAKQHGNRLSPETVRSLSDTVQSAADMAIRTAAGQALGALNLPGNPASEIIRKQYGG